MRILDSQEKRATGPGFGRPAGGRRAWFTPCTAGSSLLETLPEAARSVSFGGPILLSPACSSFDRFRNYQQCGQRFCTAVKTISRGVLAGNPNGNGGQAGEGMSGEPVIGNEFDLPRGFLRENPAAKN